MAHHGHRRLAVVSAALRSANVCLPAKSDAEQQARRVEREAASWAELPVAPAEEVDVRVIDISGLISCEEGSVRQVAAELQAAFASTGFFLLRGHGREELVQRTLEAAQEFHNVLSAAEKEEIAFGERGVGYLRINERILPKREKGNMVESFIVKRELGPRNITLESNSWPDEAKLPGFRHLVCEYAASMETLALSLLPAVAVALDLPEDFFQPAFQSPLFRLRLSHYPPVKLEEDQYGIAPHVDTSFFTLLATDGMGGLHVQSRAKDTTVAEQRWLELPRVPGCLVVNTGELLRQWSNDRVPSTPHYAINPSSSEHRYSLPFFFNATADYPMECLPTCHGPGNAPRYPTMSFLQSQGVVQGE